MSTNNLSDEVVLPELYFLIAHFLNNSPFKESAKHLIEQIHQFKVLPKRIDWNGNEHIRTFDELLSANTHIPSNFLLQLCNQLRNLFDVQLKINFSQVNSLLGAGQFSALQDFKQVDKKFPKSSNLDNLPKDLFLKYHSNNRNYYNYSASKKNGGANLLLNLERNKIIGGLKTENVIQPELFRSISIHKRILGHLSAVYCVTFDRTGRYILTGADDNLIKVWNASDSRLLATLRGHEKEISDIDINFENTLIASGSCDKTIRVWNLRTTESTFVLQGHSNMVTSVEFSPYCRDTKRWLASSGNDGAICFWSWDSKTLQFNPKPKKFIEKSRPGAQMLCISFSAGGSFLAAGSNDHVIRVYFFDDNDPIKVCELESHNNIVDSIQYANRSAKFLSGSKDGTAKIWHYENIKWKSKNIDASVTLTKTDLNNSPSLMDIVKKPTVTMVTWNCDDNLVVTAQNNFLIKVWNANTAELIHELKGHSDEIFVLEAHPKDPRLLLSSGHDGYVIIWNVLLGKLLKKFYNRIENEGHGCLYDTKWSPTSDMIAATDSHGYLTIFGFGTDQNYKRVPNEQFFHTDYRPLMRDSNDFVVDEQTQQPVHLMQPPFLVNADGNPFDLEYQRLVPGRENLTDAQLNPHVITNENGLPEIVNMDVDEDENGQRRRLEQVGSESGAEATGPRRQGNLYRKNLIRPIDAEIIKTSEEKRLCLLNEEEDYFIIEYRKELKIKEMRSKTSDFLYDVDQDSNHTKRRRGITNNGKKQPNNHDITIKNRLFTAALFDTDHEDESNKELATARTSTHYDYMDEETIDDQFIDIDEDSTTQHSTNIAAAATTSSRANQNNRPGSSRYFDDSDNANNPDSQSSDYSDWAEEDGKRCLKPPPRKTPPKPQQTSRSERSKRRLKIQDDELDESSMVQVDEESQTAQQTSANTAAGSSSTRTKRGNKKVLLSDPSDESQSEDDSNENSSADDVDESESRPCTSRSALNSRPRRGRRKKQSNRCKITGKLANEGITATSKGVRSKVRPTGKSAEEVEDLTECPAQYRPPEWLTSTRPKKTPYVPQMGDEVVYFRQGHELYLKAVQDSGAYDLGKELMPWSKLDVMEYCKVIGMKVVIKPPRLVCIKLGVIDEKNGKLTGVKFSVKYHDMPHVVDFVILRQFYEKAIERNWRPNDRFRCIIDENWYFGSIQAKNPFQEQYPRSPFQCLTVLWDNNDVEAMSPWDLEPLSINGRKSKPAAAVPADGGGILITADELKSLLYTPEPDEWPGVGREYECSRILNGLSKIMELSIAEPFNFPVDLDEFPLYAKTIEYPIDLNTIRERLANLYYRRITAIQWDVRKIEQNAARFNEPKSNIVKEATLLYEVLMEFITDSECTNPMPIYKRLERERNLLNQSGTNNTSNLNASMYNTRTNRRVVGSYLENNSDDNEPLIDSAFHHRRLKNKKKSLEQRLDVSGTETRYSRRKVATDAWMHDCKKLLDDIYRREDADVFIRPADISEAPDYYEKIKNPICFGEIREKLNNGEYIELSEFDHDCRLLFQNSKAYNTQKRSQIYIMTQRLNSLYDSRISVIKADNNTAIQHEAVMLAKFKKNRKIKHNISGAEMGESRSSKRRVIQNADLLSDHVSSPNFHAGISTRSTNKKSSSDAYSNGPTTSKSANILDKSFLDEADTSQMVSDNELDNSDNIKEEQLETSGVSELNLGTIISGRKKRPARVNSESESDFNYKSAASHLESKSILSEATKNQKKMFKIEPNQNANMGFTSDENNSANNNSSLNNDIPLSFSDVLPKVKPESKHLASSSENEDGRHEKSTKKMRKKKITCDSSDEGMVSRRRKQALDDTFEDLDEDEHFEKKTKKEESEFTEDEENEDNDDEDYDYKGKGNKSVKARSSRSKANADVGRSRGRPSGVKTNGKNLDDKENEDDCEQYKSKSSSSKLRRNVKASKRSRTSTRSARNSRQGKQSYKEETSSAGSESESSLTEESDESIEVKSLKTRSNRRIKKKQRRSSSYSSNFEISPQPKSSSNKKQLNREDNEDNVSIESDMDHFSYNSRHNGNSNSACSSRLSSRGRLLKTVSQY